MDFGINFGRNSTKPRTAKNQQRTCKEPAKNQQRTSKELAKNGSLEMPRSKLQFAERHQPQTNAIPKRHVPETGGMPGK